MKLPDVEKLLELEVKRYRDFARLFERQIRKRNPRSWRRHERKKGHRSPYWGPRRFDSSCRCHGGCPYCLDNRMHKHRKKVADVPGN